MAKIHQFNAAARREIRETVRQVRGRTEGDRVGDRRTWKHDSAVYWATVKADIAAGQKGTVTIADEDVDDVLNPGLKAFATAIALVRFMGVNGERQPVIIQHWAANRIRGKAAADIAPGTTGTINSVVPINGIYTPTTASVQLPTTHVTVKSGMTTWAELYVDNVWRVYSADCPGEA